MGWQSLAIKFREIIEGAKIKDRQINTHTHTHTHIHIKHRHTQNHRSNIQLIGWGIDKETDCIDDFPKVRIYNSG